MRATDYIKKQKKPRLGKVHRYSSRRLDWDINTRQTQTQKKREKTTTNQAGSNVTLT
jgi:hypothetical protein